MSFIKVAEHSQDIKSLIRNSPMWESMYDDEREVLEMIASSLAHILVQNPHSGVDWKNMKMYTGVISDRIEMEKQKWDSQPVKPAATSNQRTTAKANAV